MKPEMQTKREALIETGLNIFSGFLVSLVIWAYVVAPLWGLKTSMLDNFGITLIFTVSAVIRGYLWRRFFNRRLIRKFEHAFDIEEQATLVPEQIKK